MKQCNAFYITVVYYYWNSIHIWFKSGGRSSDQVQSSNSDSDCLKVIRVSASIIIVKFLCEKVIALFN